MPKHDNTLDLLDRVEQDWAREKPQLDTAALGIVGRIINLAGNMKISANRSLRPFGIHYSDFDVLATLRRTGKPYELTPSSLMASVLLTSGAMTATLDRLEKAGLIKRETNISDRRSRRVILTKEGYDLIERALDIRFQNAKNLVSSLTTGERQQLTQLLRKLSLTAHTTH